MSMYLDMKRKIDQRNRRWQRMQQEKALQRPFITHHSRELLSAIRAAKEQEKQRAKLRDKDLHSH
jgi:hypothetical protein